MLTAEQNALLTQTGAGTPGGELLRRYWQPAALSEELPPSNAPIPVRLLGEDLVLFRDEAGLPGLPGLLGLHCSHRGADLSYGRVENGGLRCLYHGWLYDRTGDCLEQPGEPDGSDFCRKVRHTAYPCIERAGIIFAYLGPGEPPLLPDYEPFFVPNDQRFVTKYLHECNYLQGNEGNIDPVHISYLHRQLQAKVRDGDSSAVMHRRMALYGKDVRPDLETEDTDFGVRIYSVRHIEDSTYLRITNFVMPNLAAIVGLTGEHGYAIHWHVPIDDTTHWKYNLIFSREQALDNAAMRRGDEEEMLPGHRLRRNRRNRYLQDRGEMASTTFTGMGLFFTAHDAYAVETQGPVQDRTVERLGTTDVAIIAARRRLLDAIEIIRRGKDPPHVVRQPKDNDQSELVVLTKLLPRDADWRTAWRQSVRAPQPV
jgi:phthalate 4,5-dioxygenase